VTEFTLVTLAFVGALIVLREWTVTAGRRRKK
jgi:hypothetical protein